MTGYYKDRTTLNGKERDVWSFPKDYAQDDEVEAPYLSNASTRELMNTLGLDPDFEESPPMPIDQFINLTTQWLKKHIDKQSAPEEPEVSKEPGGPTMISGGKPEGYFNQIIMRLNQVARKIKEKYPKITHVGFA